MLEAYGISQCGELPQSHSEEFSQIVVHALRAPVSGPVGERQAWSPTILANSPDCGYLVTPHPVADAPQITIKY